MKKYTEKYTLPHLGQSAYCSCSQQHLALAMFLLSQHPQGQEHNNCKMNWGEVKKYTGWDPRGTLIAFSNAPGDT